MAPVESQPALQSLVSDYCANMETYIMFRIAQRVTELTPSLTEKGRKPLMMSIGAPTVAPPAPLIQTLKDALDAPGLHTYSVPKGEKFFRDAVAQRMAKRFGLTLNPDTEVCSLIGSKEGLAHLFRGLITPRPEPKERDIILIPDPGYASYVDAIKVSGGWPYPTPLTPENRYLPDMEAVMASLVADGFDPSRVKALVINYPSNPIGATAPFSYYEEMAAFCKARGILLISDAAYADMVFPGEEKPRSILEVPGAKDFAIEFHSLSKPYAITGWRIGFAIGNAWAVDLLAKVKGTVDSGLPKPLQKAAAFALNSSECDAYIEDVCGLYERNQARALKAFERLGWPMADINPPRATFYLWLPVPPRYLSVKPSPCEAFATDLLEKSGIVVVPGTGFGQYGEGFIRLSLVTSDADFDAVIERMEADGFTYNG